VAEAEGLRLHLSVGSSTGYKGVRKDGQSGRFKAEHWSGGRYVSFGKFDTAVDAAVAYARAVGAKRQKARAPLPDSGKCAPPPDAEDAPGTAGGEAAATESSGKDELASPFLRVPGCKTLGCNLRLWHEGPCSTAVTGKRARVLTDKAREAKRDKGVAAPEPWRSRLYAGGSGAVVAAAAVKISRSPRATLRPRWSTRCPCLPAAPPLWRPAPRRAGRRARRRW